MGGRYIIIKLQVITSLPFKWFDLSWWFQNHLISEIKKSFVQCFQWFQNQKNYQITIVFFLSYNNVMWVFTFFIPFFFDLKQWFSHYGTKLRFFGQKFFQSKTGFYHWIRLKSISLTFFLCKISVVLFTKIYLNQGWAKRDV